MTASTFLKHVRDLASESNVQDAALIGTHAFRRGMAQDIVSAGGSLSTLLRAGDWHSRAFLKYLRESQPQEDAIAQLIINVSDSEPES